MTRRNRATRLDGRVEVKVDLGQDAGGRRVRRSVYGATMKEAEAKARELRRAFEDGTLTRPGAGTVTVADLYDLYAGHLDARVVGGLSPNTRDWYLRLLRVHVVTSYGGKRLTDVRPSDVEAWVTIANRSGSTRRGVYLATRGALDLAVRDGLIPRNPALEVKPPRARSQSPTPAQDDEVDLLVKAAEGTMVTAVMVLAMTGLRRVELLGIQWADVDLVDGTLRVRVSKTPEGVRTLSLSQPLRKYLGGLGAHDPAEYLVPNTGDPYRPRDRRAFSRSFELVARRAGVDVTPHQLRHRAATRLAAAGVAPPTIRDLMGWTSVQMLDVYGHSVPANEVAAMALLGGDGHEPDT